METYSITRFYAPHVNKPNETIAEGLTLEEAQEHCQDEDMHTSEYFDGYDEE